jgi:two-component system, sensor histidine kinase and response regulator
MKKILVIEDAQSLRKDILEMLGFEGYEAAGAENGLVGVQKAREFMPDLIICDIMMPGMDGYRVLEELHKDPVMMNTPFIFLTARTDRIDQRQGMELGADDFLTKPFTASELLRTVKTQLEKKNKRDEIAEHKVEDITRNIILALPHELRTPLNVVLGFSDLLVTDCDSMESSRIADMARHINTAALRLYRLVENYLIYAHTEIMSADAKQLESLQSGYMVMPRSTVENSAILKAQHYERSGDLKLDVQDVEGVAAYEDYVKRIVDELVDNAFKFSEAGKPVEVRARVNHDKYVITITDQGRGMTPEQVASIGAYMQFDRRIYEQQGSGLGLIIAKRLAELHKGKFHLDSHIGQGTSVTVELPIKQGMLAPKNGISVAARF